jgi:hypothetical protein
MTAEWWQQQFVRQATAQHDTPVTPEEKRPCGCLTDPVVFGHYWCGRT